MVRQGTTATKTVTVKTNTVFHPRKISNRLKWAKIPEILQLVKLATRFRADQTAKCTINQLNNKNSHLRPEQLTMEIISCQSQRSSKITAATFLFQTCNTIKMANSRSSVTQSKLVAKINSQTSVVRHLLQQVYLTYPTISIIAISQANRAL